MHLRSLVLYKIVQVLVQVSAFYYSSREQSNSCTAWDWLKCKVINSDQILFSNYDSIFWNPMIVATKNSSFDFPDLCINNLFYLFLKSMFSLSFWLCKGPQGHNKLLWQNAAQSGTDICVGKRGRFILLSTVFFQISYATLEKGDCIEILTTENTGWKETSLHQQLLTSDT